MEPVLAYLDWADLPSNDLPALNDLGYFLLLAGGQENTWDAVTILRQVVRKDPSREAALLNLADAYEALAAQENPWNPYGHDGCQRLAQEYYRLYVIARLPHGLPSTLRKRLLAKLEVPRLEAKQCRPRLAIFRAIEDRDEEAFKSALVTSRREIDDVMPSGPTALCATIDRHQSSWAAQLLEAGADPNRTNGYAWSKPPLILAITERDPDLVRRLLAHGASLEVSGDNAPPLVTAAYYCVGAESLEVFKVILDASGSNVDPVDKEGDTPLLEAAAGPAPPAYIQLLLEHKADIRWVNKWGNSVLHQLPPFKLDAVAPLIDLFITHGADPNIQDGQGRTPLRSL